MKTLYRVELPYATFGIIVANHKVVDSAPIGKWMIGKKIGNVKLWVNRKQGKVYKNESKSITIQ